MDNTVNQNRKKVSKQKKRLKVKTAAEIVDQQINRQLKNDWGKLEEIVLQKSKELH